MKPEHVYGLGPDVVTTEMINAGEKVLKPYAADEYGWVPFEKVEPLSDEMLEIAKKYYRLGVFNMEHRDGPTCAAEDQGGWPACALPAEFYVRDEDLDKGEKRRVYCRAHWEWNRFYNKEHMLPIYENPGASWCSCGKRIDLQYTICKDCAKDQEP